MRDRRPPLPLAVAAALCGLVAAARADAPPEGATLELVAPAPGQLLRQDRPRVDVRWRATGTPEGALVRVLYRVGDGPWTMAEGGEFLPAAAPGRDTMSFLWTIPRRLPDGELQVGLAYLAPHDEPRTWRPADGDALGTIAPQVRPGDTIEVDRVYLQAGATLPGGITLRGGGDARIVLAEDALAAIRIVGVPGSSRPTRVEGFRFSASEEPKERRVTGGLVLDGGVAEVRGCTFERWLAVGVHARRGARVAIVDCRMDNARGAGVMAEDAGTVVAMSGGVVTSAAYGLWAKQGTTAAVENVTMQDVLRAGVTAHGARVTVAKCRIGAPTPLEIRQAPEIAVLENRLEADGNAMSLNGTWPAPATVRVVGNEINGGGITLSQAPQGEIAGNVIEKARMGIRLESTSVTVRDNRISLERLPPDYAPPEFTPYWWIGSVGVMMGMGGAGGKPTIEGNTFEGYTRHAIILGWSADAIVADNTYERERDPVLRSESPYDGYGGNQVVAGRKWKQARDLWEKKHPGDSR